MSEPEITQAVLTSDGKVLKKNPDGTYTLLEGKTNWERVNNMTDEEITAIARSDPDNPEWTEEDFDSMMVQHRKPGASVNVDAEILQWFQSFTNNAQEEINSVLREYIQQQSNQQQDKDSVKG